MVYERNAIKTELGRVSYDFGSSFLKKAGIGAALNLNEYACVDERSFQVSFDLRNISRPATALFAVQAGTAIIDYRCEIERGDRILEYANLWLVMEKVVKNVGYECRRLGASAQPVERWIFQALSHRISTEHYSDAARDFGAIHRVLSLYLLE